MMPRFRDINTLRRYNPAPFAENELMALTRDQVIQALRTVQDPELFKDIVTLNMVKDIKIDGSVVEVPVELTPPACPMKETIERDVTAALRKAGAEQVKLNMTANTRGPTSARRSDA